MYEDDYILDPMPETRRERRDRKDAERKAREQRFMEGYCSAERDHEDGADPRWCLARASERLETRGTIPTSRPTTRGESRSSAWWWPTSRANPVSRCWACFIAPVGRRRCGQNV